MIPGSGEASRGLGEAVLWVTGAGGAAWSTAQRSGASRADGSASGRHGGEDGSDPWGHGVSERGAGARWQAGPCGATRGDGLLRERLGLRRGEGEAAGRAGVSGPWDAGKGLGRCWVDLGRRVFVGLVRFAGPRGERKKGWAGFLVLGLGWVVLGLGFFSIPSSLLFLNFSSPNSNKV